MNRTQTLAVLHEILDALGESIIVNWVSVDSSEIKMRCDFNEGTWERVNPILQKNGLSLKIANGHVVIYEPTN